MGLSLECFQVLKEPYNYITQVKGKDVRSKLIHAFNLWMQVPEDKLDVIKEVTKVLHNASLLYVFSCIPKRRLHYLSGLMI